MGFIVCINLILTPIFNGFALGFLAPSGVTFIDFIIADSLYTMKKLEPKLLAEYPDIVKYIDRVYGLKQLAKYMGSRKEWRKNE